MTTNDLPKILCVDDEEAILQSLVRIFKSQFRVLTSTSPLEGLNILKDNPDCAVILTDFRMPEMTGIEFLRAAKTVAPFAARAILSGQIDMQQISEAINKADIHKFLMKPWENDRLLLYMLEAVQIHTTLTEKGHYQKLSVTDPVTQLTNHRYFQDKLKLEVANGLQFGTPVFLIMIDVDNFKNFNDRFGHPEGDRLLFSVAQKIESIVGSLGFVSRYGGEEFAVILPGVDSSNAIRVSELIRETFSKNPIAGLSGASAFITISLGLAGFPDHGRSPKELIELADRALYQAKRQGRNQLAVASTKQS